MFLSKPNKMYTPVIKEVLTDEQILNLIDDRQDRLDTRPPFKTRCKFFTGSERCRWNPVRKVFEALVLDYRENGVGKVAIKYPGGCSELGETMRQCLNRETGRETGRLMSKDAELIYSYTYHYRETGKVEHVLAFFGEEVDWQGSNHFLKTKTGSDNGECGPVRWTPINQELVNTIFKTHRGALEARVKKLMDKYSSDKDKCFAIMDLKF